MSYLIVGLGNIGKEYAETRHNIGFMVLDSWAQLSSISFKTARLGSIAESRMRGEKVFLLKPSTYMNLSGRAVNYWMQKEKVPLEKVLIVTDDLALPLGTIRLRTKGSDGGHNGLKDIIATLGTGSFARMRVGIGNQFRRGGQVDYVLGEWQDEELKELPTILERGVEACKAFITMGPERAMNIYNTKERKEKDLKEKEEKGAEEGNGGKKEERGGNEQ